MQLTSGTATHHAREMDSAELTNVQTTIVTTQTQPYHGQYMLAKIILIINYYLQVMNVSERYTCVYSAHLQCHRPWTDSEWRYQLPSHWAQFQRQ